MPERRACVEALHAACCTAYATCCSHGLDQGVICTSDAAELKEWCDELKKHNDMRQPANKQPPFFVAYPCTSRNHPPHPPLVRAVSSAFLHHCRPTSSRLTGASLLEE
jgi:hypothetical protein